MGHSLTQGEGASPGISVSDHHENRTAILPAGLCRYWFRLNPML